MATPFLCLRMALMVSMRFRKRRVACSSKIEGRIGTTTSSASLISSSMRLRVWAAGASMTSRSVFLGGASDSRDQLTAVMRAAPSGRMAHQRMPLR